MAGKYRAGGGYDSSAHSNTHHKDGAVGHSADLINYPTERLYSEGRPLSGERNNPGFVKDGGHNDIHRAQHHPRPSGQADSFRYPASQRSGELRLSGHSHAHRIGGGSHRSGGHQVGRKK